MKYRTLVVLLILGLISTTIWIGLPQAPAAVRISDAGSGFRLPDLEGTMQGLPEGEVTLLNFWATWCPPCRDEIPSMVALHDKYAARGLKVVAVSVDQNRTHLQSFVREHGMQFQVLHDADRLVSNSYGVTGWPQSFLIDKHGKVRYHLLGAVDWMSQPLVKTIEGMLAEPAGITYGSTGGERENNG
ncbi:Peroxiredoxin [Mariprofundus ferrinatatus]|uniref:Peroxiredoxin n=1 Tax=Mariprofundus ferrinatatus TaxID=1921087 RepID=A0A2K8L4F2_9PROT|nr:TlpA disulfide reductase family protein [Mariprofundus ferrinatatus]ATX81119.1 Peroxiredoxin [Mariprofundus ferrinatatus]